MEKTGATFTSMTGYVPGGLIDDNGAEELLATASDQSTRRSGAPGRARPAPQPPRDGPRRGRPAGEARGEVVTPRCGGAERHIARVAAIGERQGVDFTLGEPQSAVDHPGAPFARRAEDTGAGVFRRPPAPADEPRPLPRPDRRGEPVALAECLVGRRDPGRRRTGPLEPGTGEVNWPGVALALLAAMGYTGPVGMEAWASGEPETALEAFRTAFTV